jgi:hypothetical protein
MKNPRIFRLSILHFICLVLFSAPCFSQNSVGIGIANSNNRAVLELVSPTSNQGFLVPRLTTAQRTAATFVNSLADSENGLLVYDSDLNAFFHWAKKQWIQVGKAQDLTLVGNTLKISDNPNATTIDLSPYAGTNTDNQTLSLAGTTLSITGGNSLNLASINTDGQNLGSTTTGTQRTITISGGTGTVIDVADNDNSPTNEIQNLSNTITGTQRTINISGGTGTTIDVADNDNSPTNEIQTLSLAGSTLSISSGNSVVLPSGGGITGSGITDQVTFWSGTSAITGTNSFKWDSKNNRLGVNTAAPLGNLHVTGSHFVSTTQMPAAGGYTVAPADYIVHGAPAIGVGTYNLTLPDANTNIGRTLIIRTSGNTVNKNTINVNRAGSDTLDGGLSINLDATAGRVYAITVVSVGGGNWITLSKSIF